MDGKGCLACGSLFMENQEHECFSGRVNLMMNQYFRGCLDDNR